MAQTIKLNDEQIAQVKNAYGEISRLPLKNPDSQAAPQVVSENPLAHYNLEALRATVIQQWQIYLFSVYREALDYSPIQHETTQVRRAAGRLLEALTHRIPTTADLKTKLPTIVLDEPLCQILDADLARLLTNISDR